MTGEELSAMIKDEIGEDARLHRILDRIRDGKANLTDSELYAAITARITAQQMRRNVLSLDKREAAFVGITRERYTDTFTVFSAVQRILDAENGIHIRPKEPGFDTGRARKIGHSLEDRTVPDSTIERRARSATENFCMSHHDDCMRVNAEFRARAGLQSYAIRDGSAKCCDWCADVSGKYPANETPAGFWGRHDNCKCSILYESKRSGRQLLRGAKDNTRRWEVVPENAGAEPLVRLTHEQALAAGAGAPVVLTKEQALALQAVHGLTILPQGAIMETERSMHFRNFQSASAYMEKKFDLSISGLETMPLENLKAVSDCIHRMYRDIPKLEGFIDRIVLADMPDIARATVRWHGDSPEILLKLSREYFTSMSIPEIEAAVRLACSSNIFSEKSELYGIFKHEAAHLVEYYMTFKKYGRNAEARASLDHYELASQIIDQAFSECDIEKSDQAVELHISIYACKNPAELVAESYSSENSNQLVDTINRVMQKKWRL